MAKKHRELTKIFSKLILVQVLSASLVFSPIAFAVQTDKSDWVNTTSSLLNQITGTIMNYQGMAASAQQRQGLNQSLQIKVRYDSIFNCPMAEGISQFPEGYCQIPLPANEVEVSKWLGNKAADRLDFYNELSNKVQQPPIGIQCMENGKKSQADDFQRKINQLQAFISQIKEEDEQFKRMLTEKKKGMQALYGEIYGQSSGTGNLSEATNNYTEAFKNIGGCSSVMSTAKLGVEGRKGGLNSIREFMNAPGKGGKSVIDRTYAINDGSLERDLNAQISKLKSNISKNGIEKFSEINYTGSGTKFTALKKVLEDKTKEINKQKEKLSKLLDSAKYPGSIPEFDENFGDRISIMEKEARTTFRDKIIEGCMANPANVGVSADEMINGIRMKDGGDTLQNYKREFSNLFNNPNFSLEEKMNRINALTQEYQTAGLYIKSGNQKFRPNEMLQNVIDQCEKKYDSGELRADDQDTFKKKVELISKAVADIKTMESTFVGDLTQKVKDDILNCSDSKTESVGGCTESALNPATNDNFCFKTAKECSNQINSCMANIDNMIKDRTAKLNSAAISYNNLVQQHINKRKQQLAQTAQYAFLNADWLTNFFKGSAMEVPVLNIKMPDKNLDTSYSKLQLDLFGGGKMDFLNETDPSNLVSQLKQLETSLKTQQGKIQASMKEHIAKEQENLNNEKQKWQKIIDDCDSAVANFDQMAQQQYADQMTQQQEFLGKADSFCRKYTRLRNAGPGPGCEDEVEDLASDMDDIIGALDSSVNNNLASMKSVCRQVNNEQSDLEFDDSVSALSSLCDTEGSEEDIIKAVENNLGAYVPGLDFEDLEKAYESDDYTVNQKKAIKHYINMKENIEKIKERDSITALNETLAQYSYQGNTPALTESSDICEIMKNKITVEAVQNVCKINTTTEEPTPCLTNDITTKVTAFESSKDHPIGYNSVGGKAKTLVKLVASPSWSQFGEEPEGDCFAQDNSMRMGQNNYNPASSIPGLENLGTTITN